MDDPHLDLLSRLARSASSKIVLLVIDGIGDLRTAERPDTPLAAARTPELDAFAAAGSTGRIVPVEVGVTPGSGPGHLALFGYDPRLPEADIGRGVLEALGADLEIGPEDVAARGNFATADEEGVITDRRAGRIPTDECRRLSRELAAALDDAGLGDRVEIHAGEGHRFVLLLRGDDLSPEVGDTDPQRLGRPPLEPRATSPDGEATADLVRRTVELFETRLADEPRANRVLLRGFSRLPCLPSLTDLYGLQCGAFAGYPLYRGVAAACGMARVPCGKKIEAVVAAAEEAWDDFDFFFLHVKQTDMAGEDGDPEAKARALEEVDRALPRLLALDPDVVAITGDHSTPTPMKGHSWHPVPLALRARHAFVDPVRTFDETAVIQGHLGTFPARLLLGLLLAHSGRLAKFGA